MQNALCTYLYSFFIVDSADHLHTSVCQLWKFGMLVTKIAEDTDHPFPHTNSSILQWNKLNKILIRSITQNLSRI